MRVENVPPLAAKSWWKRISILGGDSLFKRTFWCLAPNARLSGKRGGDGKLAVVMVGTQNRVSAVKGFWQDRNTGVNATAAKSQHSTFPLLRMWCPNRTSPPQGSSVLWSVTPEALKSCCLTRPGHLHFWSSILQYHCIQSLYNGNYDFSCSFLAVLPVQF